jgi:hypothetical protein
MSKRLKTSGYVWQDVEDEVVRLNYLSINKNNSSDFLPGRTWEAIKVRAKSLGVVRKPQWTKEEDFVLEMLAPIMRFTEISKRLSNRSHDTVKYRSRVLGVAPFDKLQINSETKFCSQCQTIKSKLEFNSDTTRTDGHQPWCKKCYSEKSKEHRATDKYKENQLKYREKKRKADRKYYQKNKEAFFEYAAKKRALKRQAVPRWYEYQKIKKVYLEARKRGWHVDHIVPLVSDKVCGLHVHDNLQILDPELNKIKNNHWWPEMAEDN